jgi:biopolymer transport protein ExbB/TolQ
MSNDLFPTRSNVASVRRSLPGDAPHAAALSWTRSDPEQRLAFRGGRFTGVNTWCALLIAAVATTAFFMALVPFHESYFAATFTQRGFVPYAIVAFFAWSLAIIGLKFLKVRLQWRSLKLMVTPQTPEFVLSPATVAEVTQRIHEVVDAPRQFVLFNRILIALSNLRNLGRVSDVDEILRSQGEHDESVMETSYSLLNVFVWAIPVLGFIGTVQGLSQAIGGFGSVLATTSQLSQIKSSLQEVTVGLSVAFETTLQGLVAALLVQLLLTALKKSEEEFLDACKEYCVRHIVGRLRLIPFESEGHD